VPLSQASLLVPTLSSPVNSIQLLPGKGREAIAHWLRCSRVGEGKRLLLALAKPCRPLPRLRNRWRSRIGAGAPSPWRWRSQSWPSSSSARADAPPSLAVVAIVAEHPSGPPTIALPSFIVYGDDV
jgi:hypothetical protein